MIATETEQLYGGLCDGLEIPRSDSADMYSGLIGDGYVNVYLRGEDGRLKFAERVNVRRYSIVATVSPCTTYSLVASFTE